MSCLTDVDARCYNISSFSAIMGDYGNLCRFSVMYTNVHTIFNIRLVLAFNATNNCCNKLTAYACTRKHSG